MRTLRPAVFLDRDGTIIEDRNYLGDPAGVYLLPGAAEAIVALNQAGWPVIVVTNQSGIGRGYFSEADYRAVADRMIELLTAEGASVEATYFCPHAPGVLPDCLCRKPAAGLFEQAAKEKGLDLARSHYVGDRVRDLVAGIERGGRGYLIGGMEVGAGGIPARIHRVSSLAEAVALLLRTAQSD